jgi:hypothetical protein
VKDLTNIYHDVPLRAITPYLYALPPEPVLPTKDILPLHLIVSQRKSSAGSGGLLSRPKEFMDDVLILTFTVGHIQDRA